MKRRDPQPRSNIDSQGNHVFMLVRDDGSRSLYVREPVGCWHRFDSNDDYVTWLRSIA